MVKNSQVGAGGGSHTVALKVQIPIKFGIRNDEIRRPSYVGRCMRYRWKGFGPRMSP